MADEDRRRHLSVAIDRAIRWVFVRIYAAKTAANARRFLRDLDRAAPIRITRVLTDNGKGGTDCLFGLRRRPATGAHEFENLFFELGIEHCLAPPSHRFRRGEDLEQTLLRCVRLYNGQLPNPC